MLLDGSNVAQPNSNEGKLKDTLIALFTPDMGGLVINRYLPGFSWREGAFLPADGAQGKQEYFGIRKMTIEKYHILPGFMAEN